MQPKFKNGIKMNDLLLIIQAMVDVDFFSPTKSRMAKELGRKDKNIFYDRLSAVAKDGKPVLGSTALEALCNSICYSYNISEYTLAHLTDIWGMACALADEYGEEAFLPLVRKRFTIVKDTDLRARLRALAKVSALDYCYVLALFYCRVLHLDPNQKKSTHVLIEVVQNVERVLDKCYPENIAAHKIANDTIDQARSVQLFGWCHLMNFVGRVICCYGNPFYMEETVSVGFMSLQVGEESWWVSADETDADTATLYYLVTDEDNPLYGVLKVEAKRNEAIDPEHCSYYRWAFLRDYEVLRCVEPEGNKLLNWGYYDFQLGEDESVQVIYTAPNKELNGKHAPITLPGTLVRVTDGSPWGTWIASQEEDKALDILVNKDIASMGLEDTDYEVVDVILSRKMCRLQYQLPKQTSEISTLSLDAYPLLKTISVWDDVFILRGPIDQSLYALWPDRGLVVKIKTMQN